MEVPFLIDRDHSSLTVGWKVHHNASAYALEMKENDSDWKLLSNSLSSNSIRKKNLVHGIVYQFRCQFLDKNTKTWSSFSSASSTMTVIDPNVSLMDPPTLKTRNGSSITVEWKEVPGAIGYRFRFREDGDPWTVVDHVISTNLAKKKGLSPGKQYQFSVTPVGPMEDQYSFSLGSTFISIQGLSPFLANLFPSKLFIKDNNGHREALPTSDILAGKVVAVYFSAHWCGPCRNFTPRLATLYANAKKLNLPFEIVFCSADHDERSFLEYYQSMPWAAIPFDESAREEFMAKFNVSGIPKLAVMAPTGEILQENAVNEAISVDVIKSWALRSKLSY